MGIVMMVEHKENVESETVEIPLPAGLLPEGLGVGAMQMMLEQIMEEFNGGGLGKLVVDSNDDDDDDISPFVDGSLKLETRTVTSLGNPIYAIYRSNESGFAAKEEDSDNDDDDDSEDSSYDKDSSDDDDERSLD